jgi:hypothetical protein
MAVKIGCLIVKITLLRVVKISGGAGRIHPAEKADFLYFRDLFSYI